MAVVRASTSERTSRSQSPIQIACGWSAIRRIRAASRGRDLAHASAWRRAGVVWFTYSRFPWNGFDWVDEGGAPSSTITPNAAHTPARSPGEGPCRMPRVGECPLMPSPCAPVRPSPDARLGRARLVVGAAGTHRLLDRGELAAGDPHLLHHVRLPGEQDARGTDVVVRLDHQLDHVARGP